MPAEHTLDHDAMEVAYQMGMGIEKIASIFNCAQSTVRSFASSKGWYRKGDDRERELAAPGVTLVPEDVAEVSKDPLGDALEAAGYPRFTVTKPCTERPIFGWGLS